METVQDYYRGHGPMSAAGAKATDLRAIPHDVESMCEVVQGVLIHRDLALWLYDVELSNAQRDLANLRRVADILSQIWALDPRPLAEPREPGRKMPCVCRHYATLVCGILREHRVPARVRCGFGTYFITPGRFEDHWIAEYWSDSQRRWILVDAQLDAAQRRAFPLDFDPLDVPRHRFIVAGDAWQMCRDGRADPNLFGLSFINEQGLWWVAQNLIRDLASLNRVEMLPWDVWGIMPKPTSKISRDEAALFDRVAELTLAGDDTLTALKDVYRDDRLHVPTTIFNASRQTQETIAL